jgi:hypothetical protein
MTRIITAKDTADIQKSRFFRKSVGKDAADAQENSFFCMRFINGTAADAQENSLFCMRFINGTAADARENSPFCMRVAKETTGVQENFLFRSRFTMDTLELSAVLFRVSSLAFMCFRVLSG